MINANEYFDGNVKSLGYESAEGKSTLGVMEAGEYTFDTSLDEIMTVVQGELVVQLPGESEWKSFKKGDSFNVAANKSFNVKTKVASSYLCQYS